jgi:hypothetical protein
VIGLSSIDLAERVSAYWPSKDVSQHPSIHAISFHNLTIRLTSFIDVQGKRN